MALMLQWALLLATQHTCGVEVAWIQDFGVERILLYNPPMNILRLLQQPIGGSAQDSGMVADLQSTTTGNNFSSGKAQLDVHLKPRTATSEEREEYIEALEDVSQRVGELGVEAIEQSGLEFNLRCGLTGEYNVGNNWADTH